MTHDEMRELLRDLISAQDDVTYYNVKTTLAKPPEPAQDYRFHMREALVWRDQIRDKILEEFDRLAGEAAG